MCLSIGWTGQERHYRQFKLEIIKYDPLSHEVQVRLYVSNVLNQAECERADLDLVQNREIDTNFWVGLFDFPMIDNTRLDVRGALRGVADRAHPYVLSIAVAYFPGSRASLKDKPYYDEVLHDLVRRH